MQPQPIKFEVHAGEFALYTTATPDGKDGWDRVIIEHLPTKYRKMDAGYQTKTEAEYVELFHEVLERVTAVRPTDNTESWPLDIQKRFPVMMERETTVYEAAVIALHELNL